MNTKADFVLLPVSDGTDMQAYVSMPDDSSGKTFPGLILFQEAFGVNSHIRNLSDRFAAEGYVVIAPELFHRTAPKGFEGSYTDFASVAPHFQAVTTDTIALDSQAAWHWLENQPNVIQGHVASTGYCMGGRASFIANSVLPLKAAISYYGGGMHTQLNRVNDLHAPMLLFWGGLDAHILPEHVEQVTTALKGAQKDYINVVFSYANHAFACDERANYHPQATKEAWALTLAFLQQKLG